MKNKKLTAVLVALSVALCGCNTVNDNPDILDSTVPSIGSVYDIDSASIIGNETIPEIASESSISAKTEKSGLTVLRIKNRREVYYSWQE